MDVYVRVLGQGEIPKLRVEQNTMLVLQSYFTMLSWLQYNNTDKVAIDTVPMSVLIFPWLQYYSAIMLPTGHG